MKCHPAPPEVRARACVDARAALPRAAAAGAARLPHVERVRVCGASTRACESEQHYVVILVRNKGLPQLDKQNIW